MPLNPAAKREHIHTRTVVCAGYRRADGLWDIEGRLVDVKSYAFDNEYRGHMAPGTPVHGMYLRLTLDDDFTVQAVDAAMDDTPFPVCGQVAPAFQRLVGLTIGPGWSRKVKGLLGGAKGCTHMVELLGPIATTAFQTIYPWRRRAALEVGAKPGPAPAAEGAAMTPVDTCHALRRDGPIVKKHWPEAYAGDDSA